MKKLLSLLIIAASLSLTGCGVYSVSSGMADEAAVCFVSAQKYDISVTIDGQNYSTTTVKDKAHKARRNIKKTAQNQIKVSPGRHRIVVSRDGRELYNKEIFVSATEIKIIEL